MCLLGQGLISIVNGKAIVMQTKVKGNVDQKKVKGNAYQTKIKGNVDQTKVKGNVDQTKVKNNAYKNKGQEQCGSNKGQGEINLFPTITMLCTSEEEIARIIILTILHTSRQHCHCQLVVHGQDSLRRGNTVHDNELAIK